MKRLVKDKRNAKLAGVCAGVANYLEIDPTVVRVVCVLAFFCYGIGLIPYILAAFIMPEN